MYGRHDSDPVVRYYDIAFGITGEQEGQFYLTKIRRYGGPVLDLGGGTGRFSLEALKLGHGVTYVDPSEGMVSLFADKLLALDPEHRDRVELVPMRMCDFVPRKQYRLAICCDAFFHNLTESEARSTLTMVRQALADEGAFAFNIHFASPSFLCWARSPESSEWNQRGRYPIPGSADELQVDQALEIDFLSQVIETRLRFRRVTSSGQTREESASGWKTRYFNRFEIENLLELCGLRILETLGYYDGRPVDDKSQLIYTCVPAR
jgi:SAM-dependent methyltransferase